MKHIGDFELGSKTFIIAEIGNNHIGDIKLAKDSLKAAAETGVDAVKFQTFVADLLVDKNMPIFAHVPDKSLKTQRARSRQMALSDDEFLELVEYAKKIGILMLTTPFDIPSVDFIDPHVVAYKIASGDANNLPLLNHAIAKGKPMLVSTGMCSQEEVDKLVSLVPKDNALLFHCVASYPTAPENANLSLIPFYQERYQMPIGYSDHTVGLTACIAAVALGAVAIEKHFILDRSIPAGDIAVSLDPKEMKDLVMAIRDMDVMMGNTPRKTLECEEYGRRTLRRTAYAKREITKGEVISEKDVVYLRPVQENGIDFQNFTEDCVLEAKEDIELEMPLTINNTIIKK